MEYQFNTKIDLFMEAGVLVSRHYDTMNSTKAFIAQRIEKKATNEKWLMNLLAPIVAAEEDVFSQVEISEEDYNLYFKVQNRDSSLEMSLFDVFNLMNVVKTSDEEQHLKQLFAQILFFDENNHKPIISEEQFIACLKQVDMESQFKWNCLDVYSNLLQHKNRLETILEPIIKILKRHEKALQACIDQVQNKDNLHYFKKEFAILDVKKMQINLVFCVFGFNSLWISSTHFLKEDSARTIYGVFIDTFIEEQNEIEKTTRALKSLADKSRFKILLALTDHELCGQDLKKRLGLSNATISHHMNELLGDSLVTTRSEGNKVIYSINQTRIASLIEVLNSTFLK